MRRFPCHGGAAAQEEGHRLKRTIIAALILLGGCKPPPDARQLMPTADATKGKELINEVGCASCHTIAGIDWPQGTVGPRISRISDRALIAGRLPNQPEIMAAFVRNAPALVPGTAMPPMPLSEEESRHVAAYLYEIGH